MKKETADSERSLRLMPKPVRNNIVTLALVMLPLWQPRYHVNSLTAETETLILVTVAPWFVLIWWTWIMNYVSYLSFTTALWWVSDSHRSTCFSPFFSVDFWLLSVPESIVIIQYRYHIIVGVRNSWLITIPLPNSEFGIPIHESLLIACVHFPPTSPDNPGNHLSSDILPTQSPKRLTRGPKTYTAAPASVEIPAALPSTDLLL